MKWAEKLTLAIFFALSLYALSWPGAHIAVLVAFMIGCFPGALWIVHLSQYRAHRKSRPLLVFPAVVGIIVAMAAFDLPLLTRLKASESDLLAFATRVVEDPQEAEGAPDIIGWFPIDDVTHSAGTVFFWTHPGIGLYENGLAYSPDGEPPHEGCHGNPCWFSHLDGPWWVVTMHM